ncbi:putative ubiquitin-conjugating enzyme E2 38 [Cornus florida]|uniref:putative ubiquitin-conjugating enzyme E2 38 n=1 Tax=Cornus florida TaxID=4283 RepID=UPI0028A057CD|nr:putative ubiquitin-conjugating enzyme E2 38 [Cornus florida]
MGNDPVATSVTKQFQQFDVVADYSDNEFAKLENPHVSTESATYKTIMKKREILEKNLPESIYVRAYEKRIDLVKAVIVGASGTPYHNGLFFFDFEFPQDYPNVPPKAHYRSFGLFGLNLNLNSNGIIRLSLLNTCVHGPKWKPWSSNILQVLLSLRTLVLNERACLINEPEFVELEGIKLMEEQSRKCNYYAFGLLCKTMIFLLQNKPNNFEDFIVEHFRNRGHVILTACKAYVQRFVGVGHYQGVASFLPERVHVYWWFKASTRRIYPELVAAFAQNDPSLITTSFHSWI